MKAYTVSANADANKVFSHIVFTSPSSRDTAVTGPAWEAAVAPVRAFLAGPPDFSAGKCEAAHPAHCLAHRATRRGAPMDLHVHITRFPYTAHNGYYFSS